MAKGGYGLGANTGRGRGLARGLLLGQPDAPEHRARGDAGNLPPPCQGADRAQLGLAVGQGDRHRRGLRALGSGDAQPQAALGLFQLLDTDRGEF
jgi:hypothetical protein